MGQGPELLCWIILVGWLVNLDHVLACTIKVKGECKKMVPAGAFDLSSNSSLPVWQTL